VLPLRARPSHRRRGAFPPPNRSPRRGGRWSTASVAPRSRPWSYHTPPALTANGAGVRCSVSPSGQLSGPTRPRRDRRPKRASRPTTFLYDGGQRRVWPPRSASASAPFHGTAPRPRLTAPGTAGRVRERPTTARAGATIAPRYYPKPMPYIPPHDDERPEQLRTPWGPFTEALRRDSLGEPRRHGRTHALGPYPPFERTMIAQYYRSEQGRYYDEASV